MVASPKKSAQFGYVGILCRREGVGLKPDLQEVDVLGVVVGRNSLRRKGVGLKPDLQKLRRARRFGRSEFILTPGCRVKTRPTAALLLQIGS